MSTQPKQQPPKNWLVESIIVTIFGCMPFGIIAMINASAVNETFKQGNLPKALKESRKARKMVQIAFILGIIQYLAVIIINIIE